MTTLFRSSLAFLLFFTVFTGSCFAGEIQKSIAIFPITANASKDISYLTSGIRHMLSSRLAAEAGVNIIDQAMVDKQTEMANQSIEKTGSALSADYLLKTTLTAIGNSFSLDAKLYSSSEEKPTDTFYASAPTEDDIIGAVDSLAWDIAEKTFGKKRPGAKVTHQDSQAPAQTASSQSTDQQSPQYMTAHPDRQFMSQYGGGLQGGSPFIRPTAITGAFGFSKTQNLNFSLQAMDVGDIDGDGTYDVIVATRNKILVYHLINNRLALFGEVETLTRNVIVSIGLADLNENGKDEIYVTCADWITPNSFAVEWQDKAFSYLFTDERWYLKPMNIPGQGMVLAGQKGQIDAPFAPGIFRLNVTDSHLQSDEKLAVPDSVNLFDFSLADLDGDGKTEIVALDEHDRLLILQPNGRQLWKSDDNYGGTLRYVGGESIQAKATRFDDTDTLKKDKSYIHARIITMDINNDNLPDIIINKNLSTASKLLKNMRNYPSGEIHGLSWNGISLTQLWRTRKIDGYISSYQVMPDRTNKNNATLFVGLITNSGWMDVFSATDSTVLMFPLDFSQMESPQNDSGQGYQYMQ